MADGPTIRRGKSEQVVGTPWEFIHAVEHLFGPLKWDLAATAENAKAGQFLTPEQDSFTYKWHKLAGLKWLNPEFGYIEPWVEKCALESSLGAKILLLVPASVGSNWFCEYVHNRAMVMPLNGRITFVGNSDPYPKDLMLCAYGFKPGFQPWRWNPKDLI